MKKKLAIVSLSGICGGCETVLGVVIEKIEELFDLVYAPMFVDSQDFSDADVFIVIGPVETKEDVEILEKIRKLNKPVYAFGTCAAYGGIPGLINLYGLDETVVEIYKNRTKSGLVPSRDVPKPLKFVDLVANHVNIVSFIPGCPPPADKVPEFLEAVAKGEKFILPEKSVCDVCPLKKKGKSEITRILLINEVDPNEIDWDRCLLEQGILCMGPATRALCDAQCPQRRMPCFGCMGPISEKMDQGASALKAIASVLVNVDIEEIKKKLKDAVGLFYKFSLPSSILKHKWEDTK